MGLKKSKLLTYALILLITASVGLPPAVWASGAENRVERLSGQTRYDTMLEIALKFNPRTTRNVVLATGELFPDALAGVPFAKQKNAPLLLVNTTPERSPQAFTYIKEHLDKKGQIYILGGTGVVPDSFVTALKELGYPETSIHRVSGNDRYETALEIAKQMEHEGTEFYLATGDNFPDALSASVLAAMTNAVTPDKSAYYKSKGQDISPKTGGVPVLLVPTQGPVPPQLIDYLNSIPEQGQSFQQSLHVVGGSAVVSEQSLDELRSKVKRLAPDGITRSFGQDRYATMKMLNADAFDASWRNEDQGLAVPHIYLASGEAFPDALAGAVLAARDEAPLILVNESMPKDTADLLLNYYGRNTKGINKGKVITVLGGTGVSSNDMVSKADYLFNYGKSYESQGRVSLLTGSGSPGDKDGANAEAQFSSPWGMALGADGTVYVSDSKNHRLRALLPSGRVVTLAGAVNGADQNGNPLGGFADGAALSAMFNEPRGLALDAEGSLYIADAGNGAVRVLDKNGGVTTLVEGLSFPSGVALGPGGELYVSETLKHRILKVKQDGTFSVLAGGGYEQKGEWLSGGFADGQGESAKFNEPTGLVLGADGTLYVADTGNQRIRAVSADGEVTTVAGTGTGAIEGTSYLQGGFKDGSAAEARFNFPMGLALGPDQSLYIADTYNHRIRKLSNGAVTTIVGTGESGKQNGFLEQAEFNAPTSLEFAADGRLLIVDSWNHSVRQVEGISGR